MGCLGTFSWIGFVIGLIFGGFGGGMIGMFIGSFIDAIVGRKQLGQDSHYYRSGSFVRR